MTLKRTVLMLALALVTAGGAIWAFGPRVERELGLSPEQASKLQELRYEHQKSVADARNQLELKTLDLRHEMDKDSPDPAALDRLVDEASKLRASLQKSRLRHLLEVRKVLTPEQWEKAKAHLLSRMGDRRGPEGRGAGKRGHGPGDGTRPGRGPGPGGPRPDCPNAGGPGSGDEPDLF
jgi:Spy/CpxP family protein refolding chaperone